MIYDIQVTIQKVVNNYYWKLKAVDSFEVGCTGLSKEEYNKALDALIDNGKMKEVILAKIC